MDTFDDEKNKLPTCFLCHGIVGHWFRECPHRCPCGGINHRNDQHKCQICGTIGKHREFECPLKCDCGEFHSATDHKCSICFESHKRSVCPHRCPCLNGFHDEMNHFCKFCNQKGHLEKYCSEIPSNVKSYHKITK